MLPVATRTTHSIASARVLGLFIGAQPVSDATSSPQFSIARYANHSVKNYLLVNVL
jgi:hypothetical protein